MSIAVVLNNTLIVPSIIYIQSGQAGIERVVGGRWVARECCPCLGTRTTLTVFLFF